MKPAMTKKRRALPCLSIAVLLIIILVFESGSAVVAVEPVPGLPIQKRLNELPSLPKSVYGGEPIYSAVLVGAFYKARNYLPAWWQNGGLAQADQLARAVEDAYGEGLTPEYYHLGIIRSLIAKAEKGPAPAPEEMADLDILLTDAFLTLGCHLSGGCVNPVTVKAEWYAKRGDVDVASVLDQALKKKEIREALLRFRPGQASYYRLRQALARYRELSLKGDWPRVSEGQALKLNSSSGRVMELRERLIASGDLEAEELKAGEKFDEKLQQSVIAFQKRHGLKADGTAGRGTVDALNVPLKQRIRQIELNMERMRWILGNNEQRSIVVNIANFELYVVENNTTVLPMKVVVGKTFWNTPIFTAKMTHLIVNPAWNVPDSIARKEILGKIRKDPGYLAKQNIQVLKGWGPREEIIDPGTVDWAGSAAKTSGYRFRQEPGPLNPLGQLKFVLPNTFDVYLHDTSSKRLFSETVRTFSHGCTRIEKPLELAEYLLKDDPHWSREKILAAIQTDAEQKIMIPDPLNVHFLYLTAWVDEGGTLQFRNDIYGRDKSLDEALSTGPAFR